MASQSGPTLTSHFRLLIGMGCTKTAPASIYRLQQPFRTWLAVISRSPCWQLPLPGFLILRKRVTAMAQSLSVTKRAGMHRNATRTERQALRANSTNGVQRWMARQSPNMYKYSYYSFWLSANNWYSAPEDNKCGEIATISKDECINSFNRAMITCDPDSGTTHGASLSGKCIYYVSLTADTFQLCNSDLW